MMSLRLFNDNLKAIPAATMWYLADLAEAHGRQELFTHQAPQRLKALREHALIESAVSSNRIEGVHIEKSRIATVIFGRPLLRDRDEEEVQGYRQALTLIHQKGNELKVSEKTIFELHSLTRGKIWDAGQYKEKDGDIIEKYPDGRSRVRFKTVSSVDTPVFMQELIKLWIECITERSIHPLLALAAFNLDFLCIHPFRDGNGRVSRLLLLLTCYEHGYQVGRYVSIEHIIEQTRDRYYETLEHSSQGWHRGRHNPWPYVNYILHVLKTAYREFEDRLGQVASRRGEKTELVRRAVAGKTQPFRIADLQKDCPGVSMDMIRHVLKALRAQGKVECLGRGQGARWRQTAK